MTYEKIKMYYDRGLWSAERVAKAVVKGVITEEQCEEITGECYVKFNGSSVLDESNEAIITVNPNQTATPTTANGNNYVDVDTEVQPSNVEVGYVSKTS